MERLGDADRLLTRHRVSDEQDLGRVDGDTDVDELLHQAFVDLEPTRGVDDYRVEAALGREPNGIARDIDRVLIDALVVDRDAQLATETLELSDGGGAVDVGGDQQRGPTLLAHVERELAGVGRLARTLEPDEHQDLLAALRVAERLALLAQDLDQLVVDDTDHGLGRGQALEDFLPDRPLLDGRDELLDDLEIDVGLEKRAPDLAHRLVNVLLVEPALLL